MSEARAGVENPKESAGRSKLQLQLVPPAAKREMTLALEFGTVKYGAWNWRAAGVNLMTYIGAMQRHLDAIQEGEDTDPDSGVSHIGHILAGAAMVADAKAGAMLNDDRPGFECDVDPHGWASARERAMETSVRVYEAAQKRQDRAHKLTGELSPRDAERRANFYRFQNARLRPSLTTYGDSA